jgi:hypothetical protein
MRPTHRAIERECVSNWWQNGSIEMAEGRREMHFFGGIPDIGGMEESETVPFSQEMTDGSGPQ